jgi:hypothetical protein
MLVAAIDRNRESGDDKFVARVLSSLKSTPVAKSEEPSHFRRRIPRRKDTITQGSQSSPSFQTEEPDYVVSLSDSAKKIFREYESSGILN